LGNNFSTQQISLPDGFCGKALDGTDFCNNFNKCLLCPKFITTLEYLDIHKKHLKRIQVDKVQYMHDTFICNLQKVEKIEAALISIIEQLEAMISESGE